MTKKLKIAFLVSIIANVLLLGVVLGALPQRFEGRPSFQDRLKADLEKLPEPTRTRFGESMDNMRKASEPLRQQMQEAREKAIRILVTEPFDEAAYDREVNKFQQLRLQLGRQMSDNMKELAKSLPPEDRKELAKVLRRPPRN
jgi:uncharacterized membrane protein